jgi:2-polyprenyl-3-methyl-5-hydroxy-6-metoxy-1,4-benzoquinol methylase
MSPVPPYQSSRDWPERGPSALNVNVDPSEIAKFSALAHRWWDPTGEFSPAA